MIGAPDRRSFLRYALGGGLLAASALLFKSIFWPPPLDSGETAALERFADVLIPRDDLPSANDLRLVDTIVRDASVERRLARLLRRGISWLDSAAKRDFGVAFAALDAAAADRVVTVAASGPESSVERIFFDRARIELFKLYYARPESWRGLAAVLPPQPLGFMDYASPPG